MTTALVPAEAHLKLHRKNERLASVVDRFKARGANLTRAVVHGGEVMAGAAIAGAIAGAHVAKPGDKHKGPTIAGVPTDLFLGTALTVAAASGFAGDTWSPHLGAVGLGLFAGFGAEWGYARGHQKAKTGSWFPKHEQGALPAGGGTKASGQYNPTAMAEDLLNQRRAAAAQP